MAVNRWIHDGNVKFDISGITVTPEVLTKGYTAVNAQGDFIEGAADAAAGYPNMITTAVDDAGAPYNGGAGFKDGTRWSSSGDAESTQSDGRITGWFPGIEGALYCVKNMNMQGGYCNLLYVVLKKTDGTFTEWSGATLALFCDTEQDVCAVVCPADVEAIRFSGYKGDNSPIVIIDESVRKNILGGGTG